MPIKEKRVETQQHILQSLPIFIISYNRPTYLRRLLDFLDGRQLLKNVIIIDNASSYPPLFALYRSARVRVERLRDNMGHLALWRSRRFEDIISRTPFILTDCDILPDAACPDDFLAYFYHCLMSQPALTKVGFSLNIADLPDHYADKAQVVQWESQFYRTKIAGTALYDAPIDTTFALCRPNVRPQNPAWWNSARTAPPYMARHLPWYEDSSQPDAELTYYLAHIRKDSSHWFTERAHPQALR